MRRRDFIAGLMFTAIVGRAQAQQTKKVFRIAFAHPTTPVADINQASKGSLVIPAIFDELIRLGYVEGRNLVIERYSGEGRAAHYPELARAVVSRDPDLIIAISNNLVLDFKAATTTIPIVGGFASPVEAGIVASLARPGGNITGGAVNVGSFPEQWGKRIQLLRQVVPTARLAFLQSRSMREQVGPKEDSNWLGVTWVGPPFEHPIDEDGYRRVFAAFAQDRAEAVAVAEENENLSNFKLIIELAEKYGLPAMYPFKMCVEAGGLMSYGYDIPAQGRYMANAVAQILKGTKPGDIPIIQPTKFELAINLKTAKALGLTVPPELLATADEVIE
jgi:putative tryptophan/tyrosine transport system substrate-binding protein